MGDTPKTDDNPVLKIYEKIKNLKEKYIVGALFTLIVLTIIGLILFFYSLSSLEQTTCAKFNKDYSELNGKLHSMNNAESFNYLFRDYYIKTAYNACNTSKNKHSVVSTCALRDLIKQGVRGLDFQVYSIDDQPVIAASATDKFTVKETYNYVPFKDALRVIKNYAFSSGSCPNPDDPLIIHFRFYSRNQSMYKALAKTLETENNGLLLGPKYRNEYGGKNLGEVPVKDLKRKIIIIVNNQDTTFRDVKDFYQYVNMTSGSIFMRMYTTDQIRNTPSLQELRNYNKKNMTFIVCDNVESPTNPSGIACRKMGCQLIGMRFSERNVSFVEQEEFFNDNGTAFVLKPADLRFVQKYIPKPKPQNPKLGFQTRAIVAPGMNFNI
tara:strand:+ start:7970 stop:9112 length:1143 start_codon:yes stop_codon:yes gene_type:complete